MHDCSFPDFGEDREGNTVASQPPFSLVADPSQVLGASIHLAITFTHQHPRYSVFWSTQPTAEYLQGQNTKRYPFLGLSEIGNTTFPRAQSFQQAIQRQDQGAIRLTGLHTIDEVPRKFYTFLSTAILDHSAPWKSICLPNGPQPHP